MQCGSPNCNSSIGKPCKIWKRRPMRWRSMFTSPFFGPVEWPFKPAPNKALAKLMYPLHLLMGSLSLPGPLMVKLPLTTRLTNPIPSPITPADPQLWCPLLGLYDTDLWSGKQKQIIPGSQPHKGGEGKILWQGAWGIHTMRPFIRISN